MAKQAGYSGKSVIEKLGIKDNMSHYFLNRPNGLNLADWGEMPVPVKISKMVSDLDENKIRDFALGLGLEDTKSARSIRFGRVASW